MELLSLWDVGVELKQRICIFSRRKWKIWKEIVITFNLLQHTAGSYSAEKTPPFPMNSSKSAILKLSLTLVLSLSSSFCWSSLFYCLVDFVAALLCSGLLTLWKKSWIDLKWFAAAIGSQLWTIISFSILIHRGSTFRQSGRISPFTASYPQAGSCKKYKALQYIAITPESRSYVLDIVKK